MIKIEILKYLWFDWMIEIEILKYLFLIKCFIIFDWIIKIEILNDWNWNIEWLIYIIYLIYNFILNDNWFNELKISSPE